MYLKILLLGDNSLLHNNAQSDTLRKEFDTLRNLYDIVRDESLTLWGVRF